MSAIMLRSDEFYGQNKYDAEATTKQNDFMKDPMMNQPMLYHVPENKP